MIRTRLLLPVLLFATAISAGVWSQRRAGADQPLRDALAGDGPPVVLELFTSQGCSSCPAADDLLAMLGEAGADHMVVIPLAYHVDYWNRLGWVDPFSDAAWTERQRAYAQQFDQYSIYTPQLVVNGRTGFVGSDRSRALEEIARERRREPAGRVRVNATLADDRRTLQVAIDAALERNLPADTVVVSVAVFENGLVTDVPAGENRGRTLRNDYVVRALRRAFVLAGRAGHAEHGVVEIPIANGWDVDRLGVVAFMQAPGSGAIHGAAVATPQAPADA